MAEVTQDVDRAAAMLVVAGNEHLALRRAEFDKLADVFASHRQAAELRAARLAEEQIVAWLRGEAAVRKEAQRGYLQSSYGHFHYGDLMKEIIELADAIERGEYKPASVLKGEGSV